jgi:hypothetical protein
MLELLPTIRWTSAPSLIRHTAVRQSASQEATRLPSGEMRPSMIVLP